ncbi:methanobactin biosynthesis protein MbnB [Methylocystis sp. 9N]|uniref:Methanobactin biosynthesis protein MbnB n=1 Tax=Methylocystis borbori TaxID=3118750 RepID=A0ABU7XD14_9HYPH
MLVGLNFTLGGTHEMVQRLVDEGHLDYCELLIDNFLQVPPDDLARHFKCPIGFHVMFSKYLESDLDFLQDLAKRLRVLIDALRPLYVSDHMAYFTHRGRRLYHLGEIDYDADYDWVRRKVDIWQDLLGQKLFIENYPSIMDGGWEAPAFFERLTRDTGAGVLFDASNAVCAFRNCGAPLELWDNVIASTPHFHIAGYNRTIIEPHFTVDSHDGDLAQDTLAFLKRRRSLFDKPGATITYERDHNIDYDAIVADLARLRAVFSCSKEEIHAPHVAVGAC